MLTAIFLGAEAGTGILIFVLTLACGYQAPAGAQILPQSQRDLQRTSARRMEPTELHLYPPRDSATAAREPITLRLRVWAARDYRTQTMNWQGRFRQILARVNRQTERWPGVRFEIAEVRSWEADTQEQALQDVLAKLEGQDPGQDVDWVVGLAAAVPRVPESIHILGLAPTLGRHFVIRSLHDLAEYEVVKEAFDQLDPPDRDRLLLERKKHKEQVVFLHEWGHTLGAVHAVQADLIMSPIYHSGATRFEDGNARVIEWAVRRRGELGLGWRDGAAAELRGLIDAREASWDPVDRARVIDALRIKESARSGVPAPSTNANGAKGGSSELITCLAARQAPEADRLRAIEADCKFVELREGPWLQLLRAEAYLAAERLPEADRELRAANEQLANAPRGRAKPDAWALLARLYRQRRWPTLAAAVAHYADPQTAHSLAAWYVTVQRRLALPADAAQRGLEPTQEHEYVLSLERAEDAIGQKQTALAEQLIQQLAQKFPALPASKLARCELEFSRERFVEAAAACDAVLRQQPQASSAHFFAGLIAGRRKKPKEAISHLRRAIELDPDRQEAWVSLAAALRQAGESAAAVELAGQFVQRFGTPLQ